ncbi:hypothetical protein FHY11_000357 [Xanthomonas arboricola]|uniref:hypothetical protein n=1 Tax=Xanthomonas euroxanthea TaxID=2259622 RepID=UPI001E4856F0|nr:hypothetical protein [Xanthomonas euroxanthea]NIK06891.1 hypothetical protein [Xanthomonas euroxanthea]
MRRGRFELVELDLGVLASVRASRYCEDCQVSTEFNAAQDDGLSEGYRPYAMDAARAAEPWRRSEDLVGERY